MSVFLDSNVVLYALGDDESKREIARGLLASQPYLSTQVVNECSHVLRRKQRLAPDEIARHMESILELARLVEVGMAEIRLRKKGTLSFSLCLWACQLVESAECAR